MDNRTAVVLKDDADVLPADVLQLPSAPLEQDRCHETAPDCSLFTVPAPHLSIADGADGSLHELETHLLIAQRLLYLDGATATIRLAQTAEVGRILGGLMRRMREPGDRR
jgi:hypothetical protein